LSDEPKARDAKLIQYLTEAHGKEKQLETALEAHIGMTSRAPYKKRLRDHLKETKQHAREVERCIKRLGGQANGSVIEQGADAAQEVAQKGAALAQGTLHALRGTGDEERMLKNAKAELSDEAEEIGNYLAIETLAESVGDKQTARVAKSIRRQEERMHAYLERTIPTLTKAVANAEIPAAERNGRPSTRKPKTAKRNKSQSTRKRSTAARSKSGRTRGAGVKKAKRSRKSSSRR